MNKRLFAEYIASFNRDDFEGFGKYYADDVVLELGKRKTLRGRQAILDFYREVKSKIRETLVIRNVIADEAGLAAEIATEFHALEDWPEFIAVSVMPLMVAAAIAVLRAPRLGFRPAALQAAQS